MGKKVVQLEKRGKKKTCQDQYNSSPLFLTLLVFLTLSLISIYSKRGFSKVLDLFAQYCCFLKNDVLSGQNGFVSEFFQTFKGQRALMLPKTTSEQRKKELCSSSSETSITLISNFDKDNTEKDYK